MFKLKDFIKFIMPTLSMDSGGGGPSTTNTNTSNIPEYARPYVETMLGSAQKELYNYEDKVDPITGETTKVPTSLKGYTPFSTDVNNYFAGFQPLQEQAFGAARNLGPTQNTLNAGATAADVAQRGLNTTYDPMQAQSGQFGRAQAAQYMNPFIEAALNPQLAAAQRTAQMETQKQQGEAVGRGAFGGSRDALMRAERERALNSEMDTIRGRGYQDAFNNAQTMYNADQARAMQAQQANIGQQQFGANLGMTGLQNALNAAQAMGTAGQQEFAQQQGAIDTQNKLGSQQQQLEQAKVDQQIKDFANKQQWSMQQLGNMSNLLRGMPMQSTTTQTYQAAPSGASQLVGLGLTAAGAASKAAKGGSTKDIKKRKPSAGLAAGALNRVMKG